MPPEKLPYHPAEHLEPHELEGPNGPGTEVPADYFDACSTYAEILQKIDKMAERQQILIGTERRFDAADLRELVATVMDDGLNWLEDVPGPAPKIFNLWLSG